MKLGLMNSRMKDYYDLLYLQGRFASKEKSRQGLCSKSLRRLRFTGRDCGQMNRKEIVFKLLQDHSHELAACGVRTVGLFGSVVRGEANEQSDVDILVEFQAGAKTFQNFNRVCDLFERELGSSFLVTPEGLSPHMRPFILKEVEYVAIAS